MSDATLDLKAIRAAYRPPEGCTVSAEIGLILRFCDVLDDLTAELAEAKFCTGCNGGEWTWQRRAEEAEAKLATIRVLHLGETVGEWCGVCSEFTPCRTLRALEPPATPTHAFDPGGRAHWNRPRCTVCREYSDHPVHRAT